MNSSCEIDAPTKDQSASISRLRRIEPPRLSRKQLRPIIQWERGYTTYFNPSVEIFNIAFNIRHGKENVFIESPQWPSLKAFGKTSEDAIQGMFKLLINVIEEFV